MSLHLLAQGTLLADPKAHEGAKGRFATATIKTTAGADGGLLVSVIAFKDRADRLLELRAGDALSVSGWGSLRSWTGRDGVEKTGLNVTADQIATARPKPKKRDTVPAAAAQPAPEQTGPEFDDEVPW